MQEDLERIMQAYLKTKMTEKQFEDMVRKALIDAENRGKSGGGEDRYDKGFSDGYDTCLIEHGLEQP